MKIVITKRAQRQLDRIEAWWHEHRDKAPDRFADELEQATEFLRHTPTLAKIHVTRRRRVIRWVLLPKTKVKLYFWHDETVGVVSILGAWGGQRGREPKL